MGPRESLSVTPRQLRACQTCSVETSPRRVWSWAASASEADARRHEANALRGETVRAVRYYTLDYRRHELHPELIDHGPRIVEAESEWDEPTWLFCGFDALDYGFELTTDSGAVFSLTWDPPGDHEGIGLQPVPMLGSAIGREADVAVWDVSHRAVGWKPLLGRRVTAIDLHYVPWADEGESLWCRRITLHSEDADMQIVMGDSENGLLVPSADNVAILHPNRPLPTWAN